MKDCEIIRRKFDYILNVDGVSILFISLSGVQYFIDHYAELGYSVYFKDDLS